jgi:hypothetical protein
VVKEAEEALVVDAEAVAWWGRLDRLRPGMFTDKYRAAQQRLALLFDEAGQPPGAALLAEQEAARRLPVRNATGQGTDAD